MPIGNKQIRRVKNIFYKRAQINFVTSALNLSTDLIDPEVSAKGSTMSRYSLLALLLIRMK